MRKWNNTVIMPRRKQCSSCRGPQSCVRVCMCACNNNGRFFFVWIERVHTIISKPSTTTKAVDPTFSSDYDARLSTKWNNTQHVTGNIMCVCCNLLSQCKTIKPRNKRKKHGILKLLSQTASNSVAVQQDLFFWDKAYPKCIHRYTHNTRCTCSCYSWQFRPRLFYYHVDFRSIITPFRTNSRE